MKAIRNARILAGVAGVLAGFGLAAPSALALDGALDTVFDTDGKLTFEPVTGASIADIAAFADGRMVAVGEFQGAADMAVLKRDGSLDSSFSGDGLADIPTFAPTEVAVDADGKIVWAAQVSTGQGAQNVTLKVGRNLASGVPDITFAGDGVNDNVLGNRALDDLVIDSDRQAVVVGSFGTDGDFQITKLNPDGNPTTEFGGDGQVDINVSPVADLQTDFESAEAVTIEPHPETLPRDDKVIVAGGVDVNATIQHQVAGPRVAHVLESSFVIIRVTDAGNLDPTFAGGGGRSYPNIVTGSSDCDQTGSAVRCAQEYESANAVMLEADGQIAAAGFTDADPTADVDTEDAVSNQSLDFAVAHLNANGTTDTGFSGDGRVSTPVAANVANPIFDADKAIGIAAGPGNTIVASGTSTKEAGVGNFDGDFAFVRYLSNGTLDPAFDHDGATLGNGKFTVSVRPPSTESEIATSAALLANGNVALAGGNINPEYAAIAVIRNDGTAPNTSIGSGPAEGSTITTNKATFTFSAPGEPGTTKFECKYDAEAFIPCGSPYLKALSDGAHIFNVRARDAAGNVDPTPTGRTFTVDATPPETNLTAPLPQAFTADTTPTFSFNSSTPGTFECAVADGHGLPEIDDSEFATCTSGFTPTLADGEYTFGVRASDGGGTDPTPAEFEFEVDTDAPNGVIVSAPDALTNDRTPTFAVSTDEPLDIPEGEFSMTCALSGPVSPSTPCTDAPFEFGQSLSDGVYTFTLTVTDTLARSDATPATSLFTVDGTPPETDLTKKPKKRSTKKRAKFEFTSNEAGASFECSLDGKSPEACDSPFKTPKLKPGKHKFQVGALDPAGNADPTLAKYSFKVKR